MQLAKTQKQFEKQCAAKVEMSFGSRGVGIIELSDNPHKIGHAIYPNGKFGSVWVSHSKKLTEFKKVLHKSIGV